MSFVNKKLGNGFRIKSVDSSIDQEHYFSNNKKYIELSARASMTGSLFSVYSTSSDVVDAAVYNIATNKDLGIIYSIGLVGYYGFIAKSVDDGDNWDIVKTQCSAAFHDIKLNSAGEIYVLGKSGSYQNLAADQSVVLFYSSNEGVSWDLVFQSSSALTDRGNDGLSGVDFMNDFKFDINQDDENIIALGAVAHNKVEFNIFTSSQGGAAGTFEKINSIYCPTEITCHGFLYSGSTLSVAAMKNYQFNTWGVGLSGSLLSAPLYGSGSWVDNFYYPNHFNGNDNVLYFDSNGFFWTYSGDGLFLSTAGGVSGSWEQSSFYSLAAFIVGVNYIKEDYDNNLWLLAGGAGYVNSSSNGDYWKNVCNNPIYQSSYGFVVTDKYKNLLFAVGTNNTGSIYSLSLQSLLNQDKSKFKAAYPCELVYGLKFKDSVRGYEFSDSQMSSLFNLSKREASTYNFSLDFDYDGQFSDFVEIVTNDLSGSKTSWSDISYGSITSISGGLSSSYNTGRLLSHPPVGYVRVRLSSSDGSATSKTIDNIKFDYYQKLTNGAVEYFKDVENQSLKFVNINENPNRREQHWQNNIAEFPHSCGIFQMPSMILGSQTTGKIGNTEDSIIQVNHFGSVVHVMWPSQSDTEGLIKGFGDFSAGERSGKLTTEFQPGTSYNVTEHDHLSLYCYVKKEFSGTLDDVIIMVERKPLKNLGYAPEHAIEYLVSGSKVEGILRDIEYKKSINYGDLSITEIGFPIDIPLTNVREARVKAKHRVGQAEENKNLIIWGRLIKADKNTNET
jgi:hypothetical protein